MLCIVQCQLFLRKLEVSANTGERQLVEFAQAKEELRESLNVLQGGTDSEGNSQNH